MNNLDKIHFIVDKIKEKYTEGKDLYGMYGIRLEELIDYLYWSIDKKGDLSILSEAFFKAILSNEYPSLFNKLTDEDREEIDLRSEMDTYGELDNDDGYESSEYSVMNYKYSEDETLDILVDFFSNEENMKIPKY